MNYCQNCGTKLDANEFFCHNWGTKIHSHTDGTNATVKGQKSRFIAGILAILLGSMGIHSFYLGYNSKGIKQLLLWVFFLGFVSFIWGIIDAVSIFTGKINCDASGMPLADNI